MMIVSAFILGMMMALPAAKYPAALYDGNEQTQPVLPPGGTDIANADDYNQNSTEIVAVETDLRAANVNGGKPNHADVHSDQEARILALEAVSGGSASPYDITWWPQRFYSGAQDFDAGGDNWFDLRMEGLPLWVPKTDTFDAILVFLGLKQIPGLPPTNPDFAAGSILRVGLYDNDDVVSGFWPKDLIVAASDFDLTTLNPLGGGAKEIVRPIADTILTGGKFYWLIGYHNVNQAQTNGFTIRTDTIDYAQPFGRTAGPFFIRGVDTTQSPFAPLPATFPFPGLGSPLLDISGKPPFLALRKK